jgi:hypothetical protein
MAAASGGALMALLLVFGPDRAWPAVLGTLAPMLAALGTWVIVERQFARAPERTAGVLINLFAAKVLLFGSYVALVVLLVPEWATVFVVSFTSQYILLHIVEAVFLRRLFSSVTD